MIPLLLTLAFAQEPVGEDSESEVPEAPAPVERDGAPAAPSPATEPEPEPDAALGPKPAAAPPGELIPDRVATWSLSAELGASLTNEDGFDIFGDRNALDVAGFRLGHRVLDRVELQAGWLTGRRGANVEVADAYGRRELAFQSAYNAHRFSVGARADITLDNALFGYIAARGQLVVQRVRFDGDPETTLNSDQLAESAVAPGGELLGGIELRIPQGQMPLTMAWTLEMGAETVASATFGDFGDLRSGGFVIHTGLGVRF